MNDVDPPMVMVTHVDGRTLPQSLVYTPEQLNEQYRTGTLETKEHWGWLVATSLKGEILWERPDLVEQREKAKRTPVTNPSNDYCRIKSGHVTGKQYRRGDDPLILWAFQWNPTLPDTSTIKERDGSHFMATPDGPIEIHNSDWVVTDQNNKRFLVPFADFARDYKVVA